MLIRLGYEMVFEAPVATPMLLLLYVHPSRATTLRRPDRVQTDPERGWFVVLRFYSPLQPFFDKSWRAGEIGPVG